MTKKNLIITIILLTIIDALAAGWYVSRRIEAGENSQSFFDQRDSTDIVVDADTVTTVSQDDLFDEPQHNTYYYIANSPSITGDNSTRYTSIKHVKVRWPRKVNGDGDLEKLNKELIGKAFGNTQSKMEDARFVYLNKPNFNKPIDDGDYQKLSSAPTILPVYGNVSQVLVYPHMTSLRLLVMEIDKVEYNGTSTVKNEYFIHYDRQRQRVLSRIDILAADVDKENKLLKVINKKIDDLNKGRGDSRQLQHALNVPAEICCTKNGILFQYKQGTIADGPIEVLVDYDKVEPFFTADFKQLMDNNGDYKVYDDNIKPESINPTQPKPQPVKAAEQVVKKKSNAYKSNAYNSYGKKKYQQEVKPKRTKRRHYNGAKRRSGYHGYSGKRSWSRRRQ